MQSFCSVFGLEIGNSQPARISGFRRYYGQVELEEAENAMAGSVLGVPGGANDGASIAPSTAARSFRETPIGVNDTRERMQAVFGADLNWAREMEKRRREEAAEEEERKLKELAEEEFRKAEEERKKRKKEKKLLGGKKRKADKRSRRGYEGGEEETDGQPQTLSISAPIAQQTEEEQLESGQISPIRSRTPVNPPTLNLDFDDEEGEGGSGDANGTNGTKRKKRKGVSEAAAEWFARSSDEEEESDSSSSEDEAERRRQAMQRARMSRSLGGSGEAKLLAAVRAAGEDEEDESSDDDTPLAQLKGRTTRPTTLAGGLSTSAFALSGAGAGVGTGAADESSDEELPLAAIIAKRKAAAKLGALDLDFPAPAGDSESAAGDVTVTLQTAPVVPPLGSSSASPAPSAANGMPRIGVGVRKDEEDDSDEDVPLGLRHPNGLAGLAASTTLPMIKRGSGASSDGEDEDDKPLGAAHPQANIIIQQQALIKQLQAENVQARMSSLNLPWMGGMGMGMGMPMGGIIPASVPPPPMMPGAQSMMGLSTPLGGPDQGFDPRMSTVMGGIPHYSNGLPPSMTLGAIPPSHQQHHQQQQQHSPHGSSPLATPQIPAQAQAQAQPVINLTAPSPIPPLMSPVPPVVPPTAAVVMSPPPMALGLDHKANSIDRWRSQVPPDATGSGSVSKASSAL